MSAASSRNLAASDVLRGFYTRADRRLAQAETLGSGQTGEVVEIAAIRGVGLLDRGDIDDALGVFRRGLDADLGREHGFLPIMLSHAGRACLLAGDLWAARRSANAQPSRGADLRGARLHRRLTQRSVHVSPALLCTPADEPSPAEVPICAQLTPADRAAATSSSARRRIDTRQKFESRRIRDHLPGLPSNEPPVTTRRRTPAAATAQSGNAVRTTTIIPMSAASTNSRAVPVR